MAKMTYRDFDDMVQGMYQQALQNLVKDGMVHQVLLGVDVYGRKTVNVLAGPEDTPQQDLMEAARTGVVVVPGVLRNHTEVIGDMFRTSKTVAAVHIGEAWSVMGAEASQEALASGRSLAENPHRLEEVFVGGMWPREFYAKVFTSLIVRDDAGNPKPKPSFDYGLNSQQGPLQNRMISWLADLLPQPYKR